MTPLIIAILLVPVLLGGGLLLLGGLGPSGGLNTMNTAEERKAAVFEVYRYSVCYVMVMIFAFMAFQLMGTLFGGDMSNPTALAAPASGVILSGLLFLVHWKMKNPAVTTNSES